MNLREFLTERYAVLHNLKPRTVDSVPPKVRTF